MVWALRGWGGNRSLSGGNLGAEIPSGGGDFRVVLVVFGPAGFSGRGYAGASHEAGIWPASHSNREAIKRAVG